MGEKEIVQDGVSDGGGSGLVGGGPPTAGSGGGQVGQPAGPDSAGGAGGGGKPQQDGPGTGGPGGGGGQQVDDCAQIEFKMRELSEALEALRKQNQQFADKAVDVFYGDEGYRDKVQKAKVTEAVVDSNNKVGENLIDIALFAAGGYGGLGGGTAGGVAKVGGAWTEVKATASAGEALFGKGIYGSKDASAAIQGVGSFLGGLTGADLGGTAVEGGPLTGMADKAKNAVLTGLKDWMKEGATAPGIEAAQKAYADFVGAATAANAAAAGANEVKKQLDELARQAQAKGCPPLPAVPDPYVKTFDLVPFGKGAERNQGGPTLHNQTLSGDSHYATDMFKAGSKENLPFNH